MEKVMLNYHRYRKLVNLIFNYLYRDAGNFKVFGREIISNPDSITVADAEKQIRKVLIDGEFFDPIDWGVQPLKPAEWDDELDHSWNEFDSFELTDSLPTIAETMTTFLERGRLSTL